MRIEKRQETEGRVHPQDYEINHLLPILKGINVINNLPVVKKKQATLAHLRYKHLCRLL